MQDDEQMERLSAAVDRVVAPWTKLVMAMVSAGLIVDLDATTIAYNAAIEDVLRIFADGKPRTRAQWVEEIERLKK
jgi:hypothetical protein